jgi:hypothetical protein
MSQDGADTRANQVSDGVAPGHGMFDDRRVAIINRIRALPAGRMAKPEIAEFALQMMATYHVIMRHGFSTHRLAVIENSFPRHLEHELVVMLSDGVHNLPYLAQQRTSYAQGPSEKLLLEDLQLSLVHELEWLLGRLAAARYPQWWHEASIALENWRQLCDMVASALNCLPNYGAPYQAPPPDRIEQYRAWFELGISRGFAKSTLLTRILGYAGAVQEPADPASIKGAVDRSAGRRAT